MIEKIIIHCSATREGRDFRASDIDKWHKDRGWKGIGYHYVIGLDGLIEKGRDDNKMGSHAKGHNKNSIGICYIGGLDSNGDAKDTRTSAQEEAMRFLVGFLLKNNNAEVLGHNEVSSKSCPCFNVKEWYYG